MSSSTAKYRNPDAPPGYVPPPPSEFSIPIELMEQAYIDGIYCPYVAMMLDSPLFTDPDMTNLSDFELNSSDEEKDNEIEIISPVNIKKEKEEKKSITIKKEPVDELQKEIEEIIIDNKSKKDEVDKKSTKREQSVKPKIKKEQKEEERKERRSSKKEKEKRTLVSDYASSPERSPSPLDRNIKVKEEAEGTDFIHGYYNCEVCHITMNSLCTYQTHINGKRHQKNLKVKNMHLSVPATSIPNPEADTKYPKVPPGVVRTRVREKARIQDLVESQIRICPGLENVIEIQGFKEIQYYCRLCDSVCSDNSILPHLSGFKHRLNSLEYFRPDLYDKYKDLRKQIIDKEVPGILKDIQKKEGRGRIVVEKEVVSADSSLLRSSYGASSRDCPSTSSQSSENLSFIEYYSKTCEPDTSNSDFYCKTCESHMNSSAMWESHIRGKRHLSNIKKAPGAMPSKTRTVRVPNAVAYLLERLSEEVDRDLEPVVGLDHIQETQIKETNSETYNCFLCGACLTSVDIIDHLLSMKHRLKYLEHIDFPELSVAHAMKNPDTQYSVVRDMCDQVQRREGSGTPTVHVTKNKLIM